MMLDETLLLVGTWGPGPQPAPIPYTPGWRHLRVAIESYVYADESGVGDPAEDRFCVVAGHIASLETWSRFNREWKMTLGDEISEFKASDFFQGTGEFKGWSRKKHDDLLTQLLVLLEYWPVRSVGGAVDLADFLRLSVADRTVLTGAIIEDRLGSKTRIRWHTTGAPSLPYFAGWGLLLEESLTAAESGAIVNFILDCHDQYKFLATETFDKIKAFGLLDHHGSGRLGAMTYEDSKKYPEIQLADLHNYVVRRVAADRVSGRETSEDVLRAFAAVARKRGTIRLQNATSFKRLLDFGVDPAIAKLRILRPGR
jgi:hypothetical protein